MGKETKSTVSDDFKVLVVSDIPLLKLPFKRLEACLCHWEASWIWAPRLTIIIGFLPDLVYHILVRRCEDVIQSKVAADTTHWGQGTTCVVCLLATMHDATSIGLLNFIATFTNLAAVLLSKLGVTLVAYRPSSPLGSSQQPQSSRNFRLASGRLAIAALTIDTMVL